MSITLDEFISTMERVEELYAPSSEAHERRVGKLALKIAAKIGMSAADQRLLGFAASVHDWGKIFINRNVIDRPVKLNEAEVVHVQQHTVKGYESLEHIADPEIEQIKLSILYHHEHYDGSGYPDKLQGESIPLFARIICLVDVFDALISRRAYKPSKESSEAVNEMTKYITWFDPQLYTVFLEILREERLV